ncbi:Na+/H+ antiporter [Streptacidiphilus sp. ASG 303]|uniref:Na+/H+ antiporter n=1 Tax=Streptacidiphilus sp. ASG 303 TaxID=2896847 RepID=UPI001E384622|nr:Na+/H+ antiporter [Streptacidiphilus sp. ASG 303]MCD0485576.1 Na+/H+ antiporter [Streptacidiphilus sp. ASG 303]
MDQLTLLFVVLLASILSVPVGSRLKLPPPVLMTALGVVLALLPFVPDVHVDPDLILPLVLPPLLYAAAQRTSWRQFRANVRPILLLAVALVLVTTAVVAQVFQALVPGVPVAAAVALGAVVSPPDPVAATAVAGSVGLPRRLVSVLEGEGLFNDVTALVIYGVAIDAAVSGTFSAPEALGRLVLSAVIALAVGWGLGWATTRLMGLLGDATLQVGLSLLVPFAAYVLADQLDGSGVLAVLVCALHLGAHAGDEDDVSYRLTGTAFWEVVELLVTGMAFGLIGLELHTVMASVGSSWHGMLGDAAAVLAVVVLVRLLWLLPAAWVSRNLDRDRSTREDEPVTWRETVVMWWAGMRGVASVALALAIPRTVDGGGAFPERDRILFVAFSTVLFTLLVQGLTLPYLVRRLGVTADTDAEDLAERQLWHRASRAGLVRLKELVADGELPEEIVERLRRRQRDRLVRALPETYDEGQRAAAHERKAYADRFREVEQEMLSASRREMQAARSEPGADPELVDRVLRALDLRSARH